jgi:hypothetical protein
VPYQERGNITVGLCYLDEDVDGDDDDVENDDGDINGSHNADDNGKNHDSGTGIGYAATVPDATDTDTGDDDIEDSQDLNEVEAAW